MLTKKDAVPYDVTIFQTPNYLDKKGYKAIFRISIMANSRENCLEETFSRFNVTDRIPENYKGRFLTTGDIILIDEGRCGQHYFQLKSGGWNQINRIQLI